MDDTAAQSRHVELDEGRLTRLRDLAAQRGTTVPALLREAIDSVFPDVDAERRRAAGRFLLSAPPMPVPPYWRDLLTHEDSASVSTP